MCLIEQLDESTEVKKQKNKRGRPMVRNFSPPEDLRVFGTVQRIGRSIRLDKYVTKQAKALMKEKGYNTELELDYFIEPRKIVSFQKNGNKVIAVSLTRLNNRTTLLAKVV